MFSSAQAKKLNAMNLKELIGEEFSDDNTYILDEGLFKVNPLIAAMAFKDGAVEKIKSAAGKATHPIANAVGSAAAGIERMKAKTMGKSGSKDDDTVYALTKEQKKVMAYIYRKYGAEMVNAIHKFRDEVMIPYSIIKRGVARNKTLTNSETLGMTKEEYYRYRESGRRKIERKGTYFKDSEDLRERQAKAREALIDAKDKLQKFEDGKIISLTDAGFEKLFDELNLGRSKQNGWTDRELEQTVTRIKELENILKDPKRVENGQVRISGRGGSYKASYMSKEAVQKEIDSLRGHGYSYTIGKKTDDDNHHGSFKDALAVYLMRKEQIAEIKSVSLDSEYRAFYRKVLKDAIDSAQKIYDEKFGNYVSLKGEQELNSYEKKIWGLRPTGREMSGDINDWYLKLKPEDFKETKYYKKSDKIVKAEKEMDRALKALERKLKSVMSEEDVALCRRYRLFSNFLTVKELKSSKDLFKGGDAKALPKAAEPDFADRLDAALQKEYNSIRELEAEQQELRDASKGARLSKEDRAKLSEFLRRINPENGSTATKTDRSRLAAVLKKVNSAVYTGKTEVAEASRELEDTISDFREVNGEKELAPFAAEIAAARGKLASFEKGARS